MATTHVREERDTFLRFFLGIVSFRFFPLFRNTKKEERMLRVILKMEMCVSLSLVGVWSQFNVCV